MISRFVLLALLCGPTAFATSLPSMNMVPLEIFGRDPYVTFPLWVSKDQALTPDGKLKIDLFSASVPARLRELVTSAHVSEGRRTTANSASGAPVTACFAEIPTEIALPETLSALANDSLAIFEGLIVDISEGFYRGRPASLIAVRVESQPKASPLYSTASGLVYVFYPRANFLVDGQKVCSLPVSETVDGTTGPMVGNRILVFAPRPPEDRAGQVIYPQSSRALVLESASGGLVVPPALQVSLRGFSDISAVSARIRYELRKKGPVDPRPVQ